MIKCQTKVKMELKKIGKIDHNFLSDKKNFNLNYSSNKKEKTKKTKSSEISTETYIERL